MGAPVSSAAYADCEKLLEKALESPKGLRVDFPTIAQARYFRHRLNTYRSVLRKESKRIYNDTQLGWNSSPYEKFTFRIDVERPAVLIEEMPILGTVSEL